MVVVHVRVVVSGESQTQHAAVQLYASLLDNPLLPPILAMPPQPA